MTHKGQRVIALDMFRGLALAAMILVNSPGNWGYVYPQLLHSFWHGFTLTDIVFPSFLFMVGVTSYLSRNAHAGEANSVFLLSVLNRASILVLIGYALNALNAFSYDADFIRVFGVLQRIGICYLLGNVLLCYLNVRALPYVIGIVLLIYTLLLQYFGGDNAFSLQGNVVRSLDMEVIGADRMWSHGGQAFDPEGLLSTLGALATFLFGYLSAGHWFSAANQIKLIKKLSLIGLGLLLFGLLLTSYIPLNKNLWTASFVLVSAAACYFILVLCLVIADVLSLRWISEPFRRLGSNSLLIYILSWLLTIALSKFELFDTPLVHYLWQKMAIFDPYFASFAVALAQLCVLWVLANCLYLKRWFLKI